MRLKILLTFAPVLLAGGTADGAVLARYTFESASGLNSNDAEPDSTANPITSGGGLGTSGSDWGRGTANDLYVRAPVTEGAADDYFSFTLNITTGSYDLANLQFNHTLQVGGTSSSGTGTFTGNVEIRSSLNGFASSLGSFTRSQTGVAFPTPGDSRSIDLSAYSGVTGTVEFRFYVTDNTSFQNDLNRFDNIILNSIPEPTAASLLLGGFSLGLLRRSRRG